MVSLSVYPWTAGGEHAERVQLQATALSIAPCCCWSFSSPFEGRFLSLGPEMRRVQNLEW